MAFSRETTMFINVIFLYKEAANEQVTYYYLCDGSGATLPEFQDIFAGSTSSKFKELPRIEQLQ